MPVDLIFQRIIASTESFPLLAIPFFITAGVIMNHSGISSSLMKLADALVGHFIGGLGQVNILLSVLMGGLSGSASADAGMQSKILVPEMEKRGYSPAFSGVVTASSSIITAIIPPGIGLILYAFMAGQSVGKMFLAGIVPGLMMAIGLMVLVFIISTKRGYVSSRKDRASIKELLSIFLSSLWALFLPLGIIMGLRFGVFTPTEAGSIAVFYSMFVGMFIFRKIKLSDLPNIIIESVLASSVVLFIIVASSAFGFYMTWERLPQTISAYLISLTDSLLILLLLINLFLLVVGMFLDGIAALILLTPILATTAMALGVDPVHFGIIMVVNVSIGAITPPFGVLMFLVCSLTRLPVVDFMKEALPFIFVLILVLLIITYLPQVVLFLPDLIMK